MQTGIPRKPFNDGSNEAHYAIAVWEFCFGSGKLVDSPDILVQKKTNGVSLILKKGSAANAPSTPSNIQKFILLDPATSNLKDSILCYKAGDSGKTPVAIAKPFKLCGSLTSATIDGLVWNYTYPNAPAVYDRRNATATINSTAYVEKQAVTPRYLKDDEIMAVSFAGGWLDLNLDARAWTAKADQS